MPSKPLASPEELLEHATWLRRLARTLVGNDTAADDVLQETWMAAVQRPPSGDRPIRPWLRTVLTNVVRFRSRSDANRTKREQAAAALDEYEALSSTELLERHETQQLLARLVSELGEPFRTTILLRFAEGLTPTQIGRRFAIPAGTVRWRLKEGLERLRVALDAAHRGDRRAWIAALTPLVIPVHSKSWSIAAIVLTLAATVLAISCVVWLVVRPSTAGDGAARSAQPPRHPATKQTGAGEHANPFAIAHPPGWFAQEGAPGQRLAGHVLVDGVPMAGVQVRVTSELSESGFMPVLERRTTAGGRFDFGMQIARPYIVSAAAPAKLAAIRHVDLRDPATSEDIELALSDCIGVLYGRVTDAAGTPIARAQLLREGAIGTSTDGAGNYELCMLPHTASIDQVRLIVRADGFGAIAVDAAPPGRVHRDFALVPEAVISGRATSPDGAGVPHVRIWIEPDLDDTRRPGDQPASVTTVTNDDGTFRLTGIAAGRHRLSGAARAATVGPIDLAIAAGETRELALHMVGTGMLRGRVVHAGTPVPGVRIAIRQPPWLIRTADTDDAVSQSDGTFVLDRVPVGLVRLATGPHHLQSPDAITIAAGDRNDVTLEVEPLNAIYGTVRRNAMAVPLAQVTVTGPVRQGVVADAAGHFETVGLPAGEYVVSASDAKLGAFGETRVTLPATERREVNVELQWAATIAGLVVDPHGAPVAGALVQFAEPDGDLGRCITGPTGAFTCRDMRGGASYTPSVYPSGGATSSALAFGGSGVPLRFVGATPPAVALANGDARVEGVRLVVDPVVQAISGTVIDRDGVPVLDARVSAFGLGQSQGVPPAFAVTDSDGRFRIADLAPGQYEVEVMTFDRGKSARRMVATNTSGITLVTEAPRCDAPEVHDEPHGLIRPSTRLIWDHAIELVGWRLPPSATIGQPIDITLVYRALVRIERPWKVFVHLDGSAAHMRRNADHEPAGGHCPTSTWQAGDLIVDRFTVTFDSKYKRDAYTLWLGFFAGWPPRFRNLPVSDAPDALRGNADTHPNGIAAGSLELQ